jgi:hypothetical protein
MVTLLLSKKFWYLLGIILLSLKSFVIATLTYSAGVNALLDLKNEFSG